MNESDLRDDNFINQNSFSCTIQSSCEDESLLQLDVPADHNDGLDVKETVAELLFEEVTQSESRNEVGENSRRLEYRDVILK